MEKNLNLKSDKFGKDEKICNNNTNVYRTTLTLLCNLKQNQWKEFIIIE